MFKHISSLQNPLVKEISDLQQKSRSRKSSGRFVTEGLNEIRLCQLAGFEIEQVLFNPDDISATDIISETGCSPDAMEFCTVSRQVFSKLAYREDVRNAIAVVKNKPRNIRDWKPSEKSVVLVAEGIEKPGNLGALLRSADAIGADAVILADSKLDLFNPNVIRSSVGCVFTVPVFSMSSEEALAFLTSASYSVFTTFMDQASASWSVQYPLRTAVVVGTESTGLTEFWRQKEFSNVNIPMFGRVDSLNVSVAVSLLLYEVRRQFEMGKDAVK